MPSKSCLAVYVPAWMTDEICNSLTAEIQPGVADHYIIAFGIPLPDGSVALPPLSSGIVDMMTHIGAASHISLAIGGWGGNDTEHQEILQNFDSASRYPQQFAAGILAACEQLSALLGRPVTGIDLDWEYPQPKHEPALVEITQALTAFSGSASEYGGTGRCIGYASI